MTLPRPYAPAWRWCLRLAFGLDDAPPRLVTLDVKGSAADWAQGVLSATRTASAKLAVPAAGAHTLHAFLVDAGVVLDKIVVDCGGLMPSSLGPPDSRVSLPRQWRFAPFCP